MRNPLRRKRAMYWRSGKGTWHRAERTGRRVDRDHRCHWEPDRYVEVGDLPPGARTCAFCIGHRLPT